MAWPSIATPDYGSDGEIYLPQVRTEFDGNYVQSRKRFSRSRKRWPNLQWNDMSEADWALLQAAFITDQGNSFSWTEPVTGSSYTVRYAVDGIRWSWNIYNRRTVNVALEQI